MTCAAQKVKVYIDFDSCYYNLARVIFGVAPWTVVTNRFNHVISVPHWLEGRFGVKKIAYLAPPVKIKLKVRRPVEVFNIDAIPYGRDTMTEFLAGVLEDVKVFAPDALIVHKDSIVAGIEDFNVGKIKDTVRLPCTIGVGCSEEEAKSDCKAKKTAKKGGHINVITFMLYFVPMIMSYPLRLSILRRKSSENHKDFRHARPASIQ